MPQRIHVAVQLSSVFFVMRFISFPLVAYDTSLYSFILHSLVNVAECTILMVSVVICTHTHMCAGACECECSGRESMLKRLDVITTRVETGETNAELLDAMLRMMKINNETS